MRLQQGRKHQIPETNYPLAGTLRARARAPISGGAGACRAARSLCRWHNANNVSHPVAHVGAAIKRRLYELDEAAEGAGTYEHRNQPQAAGAGQREGECGEGDEVHELVAALWRGRGRLEGARAWPRSG